MKKVILFVVTSFAMLAASGSFADIKIGDKATYLVKQANAQYSMTREITGHDTLAKTYSVKVTIESENNRPMIQESQIPETALPTTDQLNSLLSNCEASGGVSEKIKTAAGEFNTCALMDEAGSSVANYASVPFTVAKYSWVEWAGSQGSIGTAELQSFTEGTSP